MTIIVHLLDQYNLLSESINKHLNVIGKVDRIRLTADELDENTFNEVVEWFKDGGKLTKWYSKWSTYEGNWYYVLKKNLVEMTVGHKKVVLKKERKKKDWVSQLAYHLADDIKAKQDREKTEKFKELGRIYSWHAGTLLPYIESIFGEAINDKP